MNRGDFVLEIRKYENKDLEAVRYVCLHSEGEAPEKDMCEVVLHLFCNYYLENEPENCYVLSDDGKAVGYVICAEKFDKFKEAYFNKYVPQVIPYGENFINWANEAYVLQEKFKENYPAHLHIDILPEYQRGGWGGKLIKTLFNHLKEKEIKGVMLTTGTANITANNFYKKYGFQVLETVNTDIAFGMRL